MYEQVSHAVLNDILDELSPDFSPEELRRFYVRLGANFYAIHSLFSQLWGGRADATAQMKALVERLARAYSNRPGGLLPSAMMSWTR